MTTIAYDGATKTIAFDSRAVWGHSVISNKPHMKMREVDGHFFFYAGIASQIEAFTDAYFSKEPSEYCDEISCFVVTPEQLVYCAGTHEDGVVYKDLLTEGEVYAIGSGYQFAISALDLGSTPTEAVEYAATRDLYTGGKVNVFSIDKMELVT